MRFFRAGGGFTIVEVLVVVAIVALIGTGVNIAVSGSKQKSRDTQRLADLQQLQLAIRMYRDANGLPPPKGCSASTVWVGPAAVSGFPWYTECADFISGLVPDYLPAFPPGFTNSSPLSYLYAVVGNDYKLMVAGVEKGVINRGQPFARCAASCPASPDCDNQAVYAVYSPGAACW